jgi:hypothetical protein
VVDRYSEPPKLPIDLTFPPLEVRSVSKGCWCFVVQLVCRALVLLNLRTGDVVSRSSDWPVVLDFANGGALEMLDTDWPGFRVCRGVGK